MARPPHSWPQFGGTFPGKGAMESENDATRRRLFWEKAGKPLFGRLWTYHEIKYKQNAPKSRGSKALPHANLDTPTEWPTDTRIDPGPWVSWLPVEEGWQQGKRTQIESGKVLTCYFSPPPEFKRFWHKSAIEKYLGRTLEAAARVAQPKSETGQAERYVTDDDLWPSWPEGDWLPLDWRLGFRQLPSQLHKIYVPPNQDKAFAYHKSTVLKYLKSGTGLSPFETSKTAEVRSAVAKRKRSRPKRRKKFAKKDDYEEVNNFGVFKLPLSDKETGLEGFEDSNEIQESLQARKFKTPLLVLTSFSKPKNSKEKKALQESKEEKSKIVEKLCGIWHQRPDSYEGKQFFQKTILKQTGPIGSKKKVLVACDIFIFWSKTYSCWKIGLLKEHQAGFLRCDDPAEVPWEVKKPWKVVKESLCLP